MSDTPAVATQPTSPSQLPATTASRPSLPVPVSAKASASSSRPRWFVIAAAALAAAAMIAGGTYWWLHRIPPLPAGIAYGNGRLEADPIDIATKFAGRVLSLAADEGDAVFAGQAVAVMDTRDLEESLQKAKATLQLQLKAISEAEANLDQIRSQVVFANQEMERATSLLKNGWITRESFDQRRQQLDAVRALENAATSRIHQAQSALEAASHDTAFYRVNIADNTLVAPRDGRIQYRIANVGEVLPAGGKVFTMLDADYAYMDIYLPTSVAGKLRPGADARILLDAYPSDPVKASVTFVASQAQFTPKLVETQSERDKLMFRVRVRVDATQARGLTVGGKSGLPGLAYVRFAPDVAWPDKLQGTP